jgi:phage-related protein
MLEVIFFKTDSGNEPVREWLKSLPDDERKAIGSDIYVVQIRFPIGPPLAKKIDKDLYEIRSRLKDKISRVLCHIEDDKMILLHGFFKKTEKLTEQYLDTARTRLKEWRKSK